MEKLLLRLSSKDSILLLTWLTAVKTIVNFCRWPSSDWVTSSTSNFRLVNFSHNLCSTCPSYRSSSMFLTMIRWSASSSLIQSIRMCSNSCTLGSSRDLGWIMARSSLSPEQRHKYYKSIAFYMGVTETYAEHNPLVESLGRLVFQASRWQSVPQSALLALWIRIQTIHFTFILCGMFANGHSLWSNSTTISTFYHIRQVNAVCGGAGARHDIALAIFLAYGLPSLMRFLRPNVPILSQKLSSLSGTLLGVRGDFGRLRVAMLN